jgi:hypothetical protein
MTVEVLEHIYGHHLSEAVEGITAKSPRKKAGA